MMLESLLKLLVCIFSLYSVAFSATVVRNDEFEIKALNEVLDPAGSYILSWDVDLVENKVTFEAEVKTLGYVGFGISPSGNMAGADIFIAGVFDNGTKYGFDMHAESMTMPIMDKQQDWTLIEASENKETSTTHLKFSRLFNTCDDEDYPISNDTARIIWSVGANDDVAYHGGSRGTKSMNLLMPQDEDFNPDDYLKWDLEIEIQMPKHHTTYWCQMKKAPQMDKTNHVIGFEAVLENELALNHTHHFVIYKCNVPEGSNADELFEEYVGHDGADCYLPMDQQPIKTLGLCMGNMVYVWTKGGKRMVFPEGVGYPFPEKVGESNYYVFEVHYDNPEERDGLTFKTAGRVLYTDKGVKEEASLMSVATDVGISITIPPNQTEFTVSGHCSSECTARGLAETGDDGVQIFNSLLHSHLSGRKMKVRHFRGGVELPWIDIDNQYDFNFQQNKPLRDFVRVLPGDQLTVECIYDTTWNNNKVVVGGLSTIEEMCQAFLWYYPKQNFDLCISQYPDDAQFRELGVTKWNRSDPAVDGGLYRYTIIEPTELAGDYLDVLSSKFQWNETFVRDYERRRRYGVHQSICMAKYGEDEINVQFPDDFVKYIPEDVCKKVIDPPPRDNSSNMAFLPLLTLLSSLLVSVFSQF